MIRNTTDGVLISNKTSTASRRSAPHEVTSLIWILAYRAVVNANARQHSSRQREAQLILEVWQFEGNCLDLHGSDSVLVTVASADVVNQIYSWLLGGYEKN